MVRVRQAIVVEGRYDKNTLSQLVDTEIFETGGFQIMQDEKQLSLLRRAAEKQGLVILTDSDGAGFVIRNYLKGALPKAQVLHAYIPDCYGKEKRKKVGGKEGKLGVEGMKPEILLQALKNAGADFLDGEETVPPKEPITKTDLYEAGLTGGEGSRERRLALLKRLQLPEHLSTNGLLDALNVLYDRKEFLEDIRW